MARPIAEVFEHDHEISNIEATVFRSGAAPQDYLIDFYPYREDGRTIAVGIVLKDVTELRRLERELRRLMDELQHRVKNTLATVASIVNQTVGSNRDRAELVDTLKRRIGALAATHTLLTQHDWRDASLRDIIGTELRPFEQSGRIELSGPEVRVPPKHALTLTLTLHELATNAAKYGALAAPGGLLKINWMVSEDWVEKRLTITWRETGVSLGDVGAVKESFGTRLIKNAVVHDLRGHVDHQLAADGLRCVISAPLT
jgi:two-component system CheB/CheR fusion protein